MKKRTGILIIILSGLSILGVIVTQVFWIDNALKLKQEQFDDKIHVSLKTLVNSLYSLNNHQQNIDAEGLSACRSVVSVKDAIIDYHALDSLLSYELACMRISKDYVYGVYLEHEADKTFVGGLYEDYPIQLMQSEYRVSLSCLHSCDDLYYLSLYFPHKDNIILRQMIGGFIISAIFVLIIGFSFVFIIYVSFRQKRVSLMKNDFVNNMTHEFKTPISTVSLSAEMLLRDEVLSDFEKAKKYAKVIYDENQRLKYQVEQVLQIAVMDKGEFKIKKTDVDVHKILGDQMNRLEVMLAHRNGVLKHSFAANYSKIWADKMHLANIISNLFENANKYTPENPVIYIRTKNNKKGIIISVEDNGIGIKSEDQKDIFRQFYRVHTGNIHDVKGFGLGLYYVKLMTEAHGGSIKLTSEWGKGSTFELFFPFNADVN